MTGDANRQKFNAVSHLYFIFYENVKCLQEVNILHNDLCKSKHCSYYSQCMIFKIDKKIYKIKLPNNKINKNGGK